MSAFVFETLSGRTRVARGAANIGLFELGGGECALVDSGNDDDAGRRLSKACENLGLKPTLIVNTHSHADHCGGNAYLISQCGCIVAASRGEAACIERTELEPIGLWGGFPLPQFLNKFLSAPPSHVSLVLDPSCEIGGSGLQAIPLFGHGIEQIGVLTPDNVLFAADTVASLEILEKYKVFFIHDVAAHIATLERIIDFRADWFVPSHAAPTQDIRPLVSANLRRIYELADFIVEVCGEPKSPEQALALVADRYSIKLNHTQYLLIGATIRSYLAWLSFEKRLHSHVEKGMLLFERN